MTLPNMAMYCMRLANSQLLRICCSKPGSSAVCFSGATFASERLRFRVPIAAGPMPVKAGGVWRGMWRQRIDWVLGDARAQKVGLQTFRSSRCQGHGGISRAKGDFLFSILRVQRRRGRISKRRVRTGRSRAARVWRPI